MGSHFFAMMARMKYIERWALMKNSEVENISEHSMEVAMLAHALAVIGNVRLGKKLNPEKAAMLGLYHDCTEIITGDMPTPIKYYSDDIETAFKEIEDKAAEKLLDMLPEDMRSYYEDYFFKVKEDDYLWQLKKAADKLSALMKCIKEEKSGNSEFFSAKKTIEQAVHDMHLEEVEIFCEEFLPSYYLTLDEMRKGTKISGE
ncbi:MAG: 5'-deoxynucleotidase [Lachnospiraceae bacterium]|jgi:5'-deoxynucleotidase|nr:5'-deoxynucleotidase [Lachnospiraceae bacterium]MCR4803268.1 5'-deoxynucleotidase [Lachnospiraceae bacterium]